MAPAMVIQNTSPSRSSITGIPVAREVSSRSSRRSRRSACSGLRTARAASSPARAASAAARVSWRCSAVRPGASVSGIWGRGGGKGACTAWRSAARRASSPSPPRTAAPTTGMPRASCRAVRSTAIPFFRASSRRLTHSTTGWVQAMTCRTRLRFRSRQVASATTSVASAAPDWMKSRAISSSGCRPGGSRSPADPPGHTPPRGM